MRLVAVTEANVDAPDTFNVELTCAVVNVDNPDTFNVEFNVVG